MPSRARALLFCLLTACGRDAFRLPAEIRLLQVVAHLSATFDRSAVVEEAADAPVHLGGIRPTPHFGDPSGAWRRAIVAPPRSRLRFPVRVPLAFSAGIEARERDAGVSFTVAVDGREVFTRTLDPAARRRDRRWFDERVDAGAVGGQRGGGRCSRSRPSSPGSTPGAHGVVGVSADAAGAASDPGFLADTLPTLAEHAEAAGVTTVGVSASHLVSRATNLARGFETFVEFSWDRARNDWPGAAEVNARFLRWLERNRGLRFLAYLHYMDPHDPYTPPAALRPPAPPGVRPAVAAGQVEGLARRLNAPGGGALAAAEVEHLRRLYDAEIRGWDAELGTLLDALAARPRRLDDRRADRRPRRGVPGARAPEAPHPPLRRATPRAARDRGPGRAPRAVAEQAQGIDLFPTRAALLGTAPPRGLPGHDLLATRAETPAISETLYGLMPDGATTLIVSLRTARWKLIHAPALERYELYDLRRDPAEREDRFQTAAEGAALDARLAEWETTAPAPPRAEGSDPALGEKLRALGYVD